MSQDTLKRVPCVGSHNTMSYLKPTGFWSRTFRFMTRCQRKTYKEQYFEYGARVFDLRLFFNDSGRCYFKHDAVEFETFSVFEVLDFFNRQGNCTVRILLEETKAESKKRNIEFIEGRFKTICHIIEETYQFVKFFGGERKFDWQKLYEFKYEKENGCPRIIDLYSSTTCLFDKDRHRKNSLTYFIDGWCPWLYAKINNKKNYKEYHRERDDIDCFLIDFVDIR